MMAYRQAWLGGMPKRAGQAEEKTFLVLGVSLVAELDFASDERLAVGKGGSGLLP